MDPDSSKRLGAVYLGQGVCQVRVWAPAARSVELRLLAPQARVVPLLPEPLGYHAARVEGVEPGARYLFRLNGAEERPDPASRSQPDGVHAPACVDDPAFTWDDAAWSAPDLADYVIYELHVGTFTAAGTFDAAIPRLPALRELGVTAVEVMPIAEFPGARNWGYDGVYPFAVHHAYGGTRGFKRFVNACHRAGLAVILDVVYNHLGPEGSYLARFGPYFTDRYRTPWGEAVNFDGPESDEVRRYFLENARRWVEEFRVDALRVDAVHSIHDSSARTFLQELVATVHDAGRGRHATPLVIAESNLNDARVVQPVALGGEGFDATWSDDLHHALHTLLTGERDRYYADFGGIEELATAYRQGWVYDGRYSAYRRRRHGNSPAGLPAHRFVVCAQNHDQVGNRRGGERLSTLVSFEAHKLAAGAVLLSPYVPLLFMGEEYGEVAPFPYFVSHGDPALVEAVRRGRAEEWGGAGAGGAPPDPQAEATFRSAVLSPEPRPDGRRRAIYEYYRTLLRLRRELPAAGAAEVVEAGADAERRLVWVRRRGPGREWVLLLHFGAAEVTAPAALPGPGAWHLRLDSAAVEWQGPGSRVPAVVGAEGGASLVLAPQSAVVMVRA